MKKSELIQLIESIVRKQISNCRLNERIVPKFKKSKNSIPENERKLSAKYLALYNFGFENFVKKYGSISKAYKIANQELEDEGDWTLDYIQASDGYWDMYDRIIKGDDYVFNIWNALDNRYKK